MWKEIRRLFLMIGLVACIIIMAWPFILIAGLGAENHAEYIQRALRVLALAMLTAPVALTIGWYGD